MWLDLAADEAMRILKTLQNCGAIYSIVYEYHIRAILLRINTYKLIFHKKKDYTKSKKLMEYLFLKFF